MCTKRKQFTPYFQSWRYRCAYLQPRLTSIFRLFRPGTYILTPISPDSERLPRPFIDYFGAHTCGFQTSHQVPMDPFRKVHSLYLQSICACTMHNNHCAHSLALTIKAHPTEPTLAESKHRTLIYNHVHQAQAIYSLLSILAVQMCVLATSPYLHISPISPRNLHSNSHIS